MLRFRNRLAQTQVSRAWRRGVKNQKQKTEHKKPLVGNQQHDIDVAKLNRKVQFSEYVRPVCLPDFVPPVVANIHITGQGSIKQVRYLIREYLSLIFKRGTRGTKLKELKLPLSKVRHFLPLQELHSEAPHSRVSA